MGRSNQGQSRFLHLHIRCIFLSTNQFIGGISQNSASAGRPSYSAFCISARESFKKPRKTKISTAHSSLDVVVLPDGISSSQAYYAMNFNQRDNNPFFTSPKSGRVSTRIRGEAGSFDEELCVCFAIDTVCVVMMISSSPHLPAGWPVFPGGSVRAARR